MKNYHQDYFYMVAEGDNTPRLSFDKNQINDTHLLFAERQLDESYVVSLKFGYPIPKKTELGDVLKKAQHSIVSEKIKDLFKGMDLKEVQFLPTEIRDPQTEEIYTNYYVLHIYNLINCLNHEESKYDMSNGFVSSIEKLVFDHEKLGQIPLKNRLVFALGEQRLSMFFHRSIVEKIIAMQPENLKFSCLATKDEIDEPFDEIMMEYIIIPEKEVEIEEEDDELSIWEELRNLKLDGDNKPIEI